MGEEKFYRDGLIPKLDQNWSSNLLNLNPKQSSEHEESVSMWFLSNILIFS